MNTAGEPNSPRQDTICVVTAYPPGRKDLGGGGWVDRRILKALTAHNLNIELITVTGPSGHWTQDGYSGVSEGSIPLEMRNNRLGLLRIAATMMYSAEPYLAKKFTNCSGWSQAAQLLRSRVKGKPVLTSGWPSLLLAHAARIPVAAHIAHNVDSVIAAQHSPKALRILGEPARLRKKERTLLQRPKKVFTLSTTDAQRLHAWGITASTLPLPLSPHLAREKTHPRAVGFIGKASWPPNASALATLLGPVHDELTRLGVDVDYVLAGKGTERFSEHPRVSSAGWVHDETEFYARIGLAVVPRFGSSTGISIKMLEAAEYGVPAIVSDDVSRAVDVNGPWLTAADPRGIAAAIAQWRNGEVTIDTTSWVEQHAPLHTATMLANACLSESKKDDQLECPL